jgi:RNA polymerase sigma-70 factor, ECF subfamily
MESGDGALVERAREGDAEAFEALVRRHLRAAYAVALARLGSPEDAEDASQDAFMTALQKLDECRDPERFGAWLLAIVRNRALDLLRRRQVREAVPLERAPLPAAVADPYADAEGAELRRALLAALSHLTELQREVLLLFDFEGWSHKEIARRLGISPGAARFHLHAGRTALKQRWGQRFRETEGE